MFCKESDDDVNDFMKGFGHILKLWVLLPALSSINTAWDLSREHWWGLIIFKSI